MPEQNTNNEFIVYEDDACLNQPLPDLSPLQFFNNNGEPVNLSDDKYNNKLLAITFFSKLNKGDFPTLTVLNNIAQKEAFKGKLNFIAISRDGEVGDVERFPEKYKDKFISEIKGPNDEVGYEIKFDYPLAFDPEGQVNNAFKNLAKKAVVGVGMTFVAEIKEGKGVIRWFEYFIRGANPMQQFEEQIERLVNKQALISNGKTPEEEEEEELDGGTAVPAGANPFADVKDNY